MHNRYRSLIVGVIAPVLSAAGPTAEADLSIWALQSDLQAAAGDPGTTLPAISIAYNPTDGKLLIACGGDAATIFEWGHASTNGTVLVPRANWGTSGTPQPYACATIPDRDTFMVADGGGDNVILEVIPGVAGQTPSVFLSMVPPTFPAGGMPVDDTYAYYKNEWTGVQETVNRFTLVGTNGVESEHIPYSAFQDAHGTGPEQQFVIDSAGDLILSLDTSGAANDPYKGLYRWDSAASTLVPIVQAAEITAHTGETDVDIYGLAVDLMDNLYFFDACSGWILRVDARGWIGTVVTIDEVRGFMNDPGMPFWPTNMAAANNLLIFTTGEVSGHILTARVPLDVEMVIVPGTDYEVDGPAYTYEIGKFEITNAQYCTFLNDAELIQQTNPSDPRCTNMWVHPSNPYKGDVYMMDVTVFPPETPDWYDRTLYKTSDIPDSKIKYDDTQGYGSRFYVLSGFQHHPVGTVSWFGAAKFCNWLTIDSSMDASEICYREGTSKYDWYAIMASDWSTNGLLDSERLDLVRNYHGYRLPMDGAGPDIGTAGVGHYWNIDANPYNEWYKAAAFDPTAPDTVRAGPGDNELVQPDHWIFGYGADTNTNADGNRGDHGFAYPFHETTQVGFYDGVNTLNDGTPTTDTRNPYGLYDAYGNVNEWTNDTFLQYPWDSTYRAVRGGNWANSAPKWMTNSVRIVKIARYYAENRDGFRVARSFGYGDFDADGDVDLDDYAFFASAMTGPVATVTPGSGHEACDYDGDNHVDLLDFARFQQLFDTAP